MNKLILPIVILLLFVSSVHSADVKWTAKNELTTPIGTDIFLMVDDPGGTPLSKWVTLDNMSAQITGLGTISTGTWSATDVALAAGGTGASLSDPGADRILFWDDTASSITWLVANTGLAISGTNLNWSASLDEISNINSLTEAAGDVLYYTGSAWDVLNIATESDILAVSAGGIPEWITPTYLTASSTNTFTNKTLNADGTGNALSNVDEDNCKAASDLVRSAIQFVIDGGGSAISAGGGTPAGYIEIPFGCTIVRGSLLADQVGSIVVDVWVDDTTAFDGGTLVDADSIMDAGTPLTIANENYESDSTMTSWTTTLTAAEIMAIHVDSCTTITRCTISLIVEK